MRTMRPNTRMVACAVLAIAAVLILSSRYASKNDCSTPQSTAPKSAASEFKVPLLENPVKIDSKCLAYTELSDVDFLHDELRARLCDGTPAFTLVNGRFPPCKVPWDLPLTHLISPEKVTMPKLFKSLKPFTIYAHKGELLTAYLKGGGWENSIIKMIVLLIKEVGFENTTFLDIGCNVGIYSLTVRSFGVKTVCIDANIRNLVRVLMSAKDMNFIDDKSFRMFWTFFNSKVSIEHFRFVSKECHIGAGTPFLAKSITFEDPMPVASSRGDDLIGQMPSKLLVIKIDIESYEPVFFESAKQFFKTHRVAAVMMEIYRNPFHQRLEIDFLEDFFFSRKYKLFTTALQEGSLRNWSGGNEALWVHEDFVPLLKNIPKL